jgi:cyclophilin family peptidyl-prolyl cis-trans isomerase
MSFDKNADITPNIVRDGKFRATNTRCGSQVFIYGAPTPWLRGKHTALSKEAKGNRNGLKKIAEAPEVNRL